MNRATRIIVSTIGVLLAISGLNHGFFEVLQGNTPTNGVIIQAIGEGQRMWLYGSEEAFTILPTFLWAGILTILVSTIILVWSIGFVHKKNGPFIFIALFILLFLVGGGIGQIIFFTLAWAVATRINKPLVWWERVMPKKVRSVLRRLWRPFLMTSSLLFLIGLFIAITGLVPGLDNPEQILTIDWLILAGGLLFFGLSAISGFADDIERMIPSDHPRPSITV
ncbi:MAG: hypothetical protein QNJ45_22310 [Ardenticatenaceae bacterium]|nr:hypothetical protein [Ardenticatenaceae bacterium]